MLEEGVGRARIGNRREENCETRATLFGHFIVFVVLTAKQWKVAAEAAFDGGVVAINCQPPFRRQLSDRQAPRISLATS